MRERQSVRTRAQRDPRQYLRSSVRIISGYGTRGASAAPFESSRALQAFEGWVYAAARLNAQVAASVPLRMYARRGSALASDGVRPSRSMRAYLRGESRLALAPSASVMRKAVEMRDEYVEVTRANALLNLLKAPNAYTTGYDLAVLRYLYLELTGNAYLHPIVGPSGQPVELWSMPSQWIRIIPAAPETGELVAGYVYGSSGGTEREFAADEVLHERYPNPRNQYYGLGKVEAGWNVVQQNAAAHAMDYAMYANCARPDYAVIVKSGASDVAMRRFEERIKEQMSGPSRRGRFLTITGDTQIVPLNWPPKDLAGRDDIVEEIAAVFGVPVSLLKANDPNLASAQTGFAAYRSLTIASMVRTDEEFLNGWLLPLFGYEDDAYLAYDPPAVEDLEQAQRIRSAYVQAGVMTINEARAELGLEPVEGGDAPRVSGLLLDAFAAPAVGADAQDAAPATTLNGAQIQSALEVVQALRSGAITAESAIALLVAVGIDDDVARRMAGAETSAPPPPQPDQPQEQPEPGPPAAGDAAKAILQSEHRYDACVCQHLGERGSKRMAGAMAREYRQMVRSFGARVRSHLADMQERVIEAIESTGKAAASKAPSIEDIVRAVNDYRPALSSGLREAVADALGLGGRHGAAALDADVVFTIDMPEAQDFIATYTARLVGSITDTTLARLSATLREGFEAGDTPKELAHRIEQLDSAFGPERAEVIARTEAARAYVQGEIEAWRQSGVVEGKRWMLAANACEFCEAAARAFNAQPLGLDDVPDGLRRGAALAGTRGGVMSLDYEDISGPPLHPQCGCELMPVLREVHS